MSRFMLPGLWVSAAFLWVVWFNVIEAASVDTLSNTAASGANTVSTAADTAIVVAKTADLPAPGASAGSSGDCINVNTSDETALTRLNGVGPVLAGRIVALKKSRGTYKNAQELLLVKGIGPVKLKKMQDQICF